MTEKFEFNSEVYMDGVRQIPQQINVAPNAQGVLTEHMGDASVNGDDIYRIPVNDTALMLTVDGKSSVRLYAKDFEANRHLATLTVVESTVDGIRLRENNTIVHAIVTNCYMRDSYIGFNKNWSNIFSKDIENVHLENSRLENTWLPTEADRNMCGVETDSVPDVYIRGSEIYGSGLFSSYGIDIQSSQLKNCHLTAQGGKLILLRAFLNDINIDCQTGILLLKGHWNDMRFKPIQFDVWDQFQFCRIDTPDTFYYFYHTGDGIYCVDSHKSYISVEVDRKFGETFQNEILNMVADGCAITDFTRSQAQFVIDSIQSRMKVIEAMERMGFFDPRGEVNDQKGGEE